MNKAYVFIDESGDAGFKLEKGSSKNFIICCVIFLDALEVERAALRMKEIRRKIGKSDRYEFKFNKMTKKERITALTGINKFNFTFRAIVVQKEKIYSKELKGKKEKFYNYFIKMLLKYNRKEIKDAKIVIDGSGDRIFKREMLTYLRKDLNKDNKKTAGVIKIKDSKNNFPIQLADLIAGSINRSYSNKTDSKIYLNIVQKHKDDIWEFK